MLGEAIVCALLATGAMLSLSILSYVGTLARRGPDLRLAGNTRVVVIGLLIATVTALPVPVIRFVRFQTIGGPFGGPLELLLPLLGCGAVVAYSVFGLWSLRLVEQHASLLHTAARQARATWAAQDFSPRHKRQVEPVVGGGNPPP